MLNVIEYFFSLFYMPMHGLLKKKNMQRKMKSRKNQNVLYMIASMYSRRCGSYRMYLEDDSSYQTVMIMCELKRFSHISNRHNMQTLMQSCDVFFTHNMQYTLLLLIHVQVQCELAITRNTFVNVCLLNYFNLFLKYKIGLTCLVCVCVLDLNP